jgi:regulator of protease activity HflC (stomatin/prohibitin superfamily)
MRRLVLLAFLVLAGCSNQTTPEGQVGYVYHVPLAFGRASFIGIQRGPTSTGMVWRQWVINVDVRPKNYSEEFHILSRDNLTVGFEAHARISIRPEGVRQLVERLGAGEDTGTIPEWYSRAVKQPYRSAVNDVVHEYDAYDIQTQTQEIGSRILDRLRNDFASTPIEFESISIGNLTYPEEINVEIQRKLAAEQDLERMERERQIAEQEAQIVVTNAHGRAAAQRIVNETLTPLYVQHEMLEAFRELSRSDRVTIVAAPTNDTSGSPVILNLER